VRGGAGGDLPLRWSAPSTRGDRHFSRDDAAVVEQNPIALGRGSASGRAALERRAVHIHDVLADPEFTFLVGQLPFRTLLAIPMLRGDELLGVILIRRDEVRPFTDGQIALMETFADQAAIAIENAHLLTELQDKNASRPRSLEQQTATAEILRVISSSPTEIRPVLDTIVASSVRLCDGKFGVVATFDGEMVQPTAFHNYSADALCHGTTHLPDGAKPAASTWSSHPRPRGRSCCRCPRGCRVWRGAS
jgi:hypothetical protein